MKLCFIDVETTGLKPQLGDAICELAAVTFSPERKLISRFIRIVNPGRPIPPSLVAIHGISKELASYAPTFKEIADEFLDYIRGTTLLGYNIKFDIGFLEAEYKRIGKAFPSRQEIIDVLALVKVYLPGLRSYKLSSVARYLGASEDAFHWAESDVMTTAFIFFYLVENVIKKPIAEVVKDNRRALLAKRGNG